MNTFHKHLWTFTVLFVCNLSYLLTQQVINNKGDNGSPSDVHIECNSEAIMVTINTTSCYNGMIYPKGLATNSSCMLEFNDRDNVTYVLPLRSCNTMSADVDDGVEYFNTVVFQPHRKLVTNQGKDYHIKCKYHTKERTISNSFNMSSLGTTPVMVSASLPSCSMKIYATDTKQEVIAENVKIGDKLTLTISIDDQDVYGLKVTNCMVRDGLNWGQQPLINDDGCPIDEEIMPNFEYSHNLTRATVNFQAHKFPYTSSVYYQCNVKLCFKENNLCSDVPPDCTRDEHGNRKKRSAPKEIDLEESASEPLLRLQEIKDLSVEVHSGLYVNEADDEEEIDYVAPRKVSTEDEFCISMKKFGIGVAIASLLLALAVILLVACILQRRRRRKDASTTASSIYSGPYTNRAYSRD